MVIDDDAMSDTAMTFPARFMSLRDTVATGMKSLGRTLNELADIVDAAQRDGWTVDADYLVTRGDGEHDRKREAALQQGLEHADVLQRECADRIRELVGAPPPGEPGIPWVILAYAAADDTAITRMFSGFDHVDGVECELKDLMQQLAADCRVALAERDFERAQVPSFGPPGLGGRGEVGDRLNAVAQYLDRIQDTATQLGKQYEREHDTLQSAGYSLDEHFQLCRIDPDDAREPDQGHDAHWRAVHHYRLMAARVRFNAMQNTLVSNVRELLGASEDSAELRWVIIEAARNGCSLTEWFEAAANHTDDSFALGKLASELAADARIADALVAFERDE